MGSPYQSLREAIRVLQTGRPESAAVINAEGQLVGAISPGDLMAATLTSGHTEGTVGQLMQTQLVTYAPDTSAREVCEFLCRAAVLQAFVVDGTQPLGVIRRANFIRWLAKSMQTSESGQIEALANTSPAEKSVENALSSGLA